ncbi:ABC transporter ATP-binding protein [Candidatus Saccharibacteria bacterium]|nr:ABC transporter ATP-binding protein [Candidatus Saccharibacteria bacterium]
MADNLPVIEVSKLSKRYPGASNFAIKDLNLKINPGEVYGFLGPNGAGKSTTIRLLMNFIQPTSGGGKIAGRDIVTESVAIKRQVGYLAGDVELYPKMTGHQFLRYLSELQPPKRASYQQELAKIFQANLSRRIDTLSKGNRQKIGLIQALMHEPEVLILDEPTGGLDPLMQEAFYELVKSTKAKGTTFFISSHNLAEVQKMCDRVGFIRDGQLISEVTIADLSKTAVQTFDVTFAAEAPLLELKKLKHTQVTSNSPSHVSVHIRGDLSPLFTVLAHHGVLSLDSRGINLEEEFLRFYKGSKR